MPEQKPKKEPTIVVTRLTKTGAVETKISKAVGNQIVSLRAKIQQMTQLPALSEVAAENVAALTKLMNFVEF